jgi:FAD/FMN-containing dehydrogenase
MAGITAVTVDGSRTNLPPGELDELTSRMQGEVIRADGGDYHRARALWNGMIDRRPAALARCATDADVVAAIGFAREHDLLLAVRGGGHGVAGDAVCDGGLVVDLSGMRGAEVDEEAITVRAQGGCTLGDVDAVTQRYARATPLGVVTETGIAGLTLSGGLGWLRRKYGLSCDNLVSAKVATADGRLLTASADENEDLFWAIRGGGGNFGVVTSFEYRLHPIGPEVAFCYVLYPAEHAGEVLRFCADYVADVEALAPVGVLGRVPAIGAFPEQAHGMPFIALLAMYAGDPDDGDAALRPLRQVTEAIGDLSGKMPYTEVQSALDEDYPAGWHYYWKSLNLPELTDEVIDRLVGHIDTTPALHSTIDVWFQGGEMARVPDGETAFANRRSPYLIGIEGNWEGEAGDEETVAWVRDCYNELRSFSDGGIYLNFPGFLEEGEQLLHEAYGDNYQRLRDIKARYDPENLFRLNANIRPG